MIAAIDKILSEAGNDTKIVPGHGLLGNRADLTKLRDMLITARDRVEKLKSAGKSVQESVAEKPFADLDPVWGERRRQRRPTRAPLWNLDTTNLRNSTALAGT